MRYDNWDDFMAAQRRSGLLQRISDFVTAERRGWFTPTTPAATATKDGPPVPLYPPSADVFRFTTTPLRDVKVVILGQDPYHGPGQAHGLAFSVPEGVALPPSLKNIFKELWTDCGDGALRTRAGWGAGLNSCLNGDLTPWTRHGVLLLNTALTVRQADPGSHLYIWQPFTDEVVRAVVDSPMNAPHFILWGKPALKTFQRCVMTTTRRVDEIAPGIYLTNNVTYTHSTHPSPLSADRGFFGSRPFSRANEALRLRHSYGNDAPPQVDWRLP